MNPATLKFIVFLLFSTFSLALGYKLRNSKAAASGLGRKIHLHTILWSWSPFFMIGFWQFELSPLLAYIMLFQPVMMGLVWIFMLVITRFTSYTRETKGVLLLNSLLSNQGFTLGGYLCFVLLEPGELALSYAVAYITSLQICAIVLLYPLAFYYSPAEDNSPLVLIRKSFLDLRAMPLYAALAGLLLNVLIVPFPQQIYDWHLVDVLFFAGAAGGYGGIGLGMKLPRDKRPWGKIHLLSFVKFLVFPALTLGLLALTPLIGFAVPQLAQDVLLLESFMPTAIVAVVIANLFGLNANLAGDLWFYNTIFFCLGPLLFILWFF